jgi:hypothetical protein
MRLRLLLSTVILSTGALALWAGAAATTWADFLSGRGLTIECVGAGVLTLLADRRWSERCNRDRTMLYLINRAVTSRRAAQTEEVPLRVARGR